MPDPLEDRLHDFAAGVPALSPASAAEVRRRGDRLRKRRTMLVTAGAAFAVAAVTVPVLALTGSDRTTEQPAQLPTISVTTATDASAEPPSPLPSTSATTDAPTEQPSSLPTAPVSADRPDEDPTTTTDPPAPPLTEALLPSPDDLTVLDGLEAWRETEPADDGLIGCQPAGKEINAADRVTRAYATRVSYAPQGVERGISAEARVTVLQLGSVADAEAAADTVAEWIRTCADPGDPDLSTPFELGDLVVTDNGTFATHVYTARYDVCSDDCDAVWYDDMGFLISQDRLIVASLREVGGEQEEDDLDVAMRDLLREVAGLNSGS